MSDQISFRELLDKAVSVPGVISAAYSAFHDYSLGNQIIAFVQCERRGIAIGPIATFMGWKNKGRYVRKGERAIVLCMPITCKRRETEPVDAGAESDGAVFTRFVYRPNWFVLAQTDGADMATEAPIAEWSIERALPVLDIAVVPFESLNGNTQGFARDRCIAVSPVAAFPHKTRFHELAHVVLGHTAEAGAELSDDDRTPRSLREVEAESVAMICVEVLGLPGATEARGYIQHWNAARSDDAIPERSAQRIFKAADQILKAGRPAPAANDATT